MRAADKQIADILVRYGEPFGGNVWRVQGTAVIYHKTLERIAAQAGIVFEPPQIIRAERDEAVILVTGRIKDDKGVERAEWSMGEALINVNYRVSGKQAAYVYAMAEKRGKDRVILKLIDLHGLVYSEEEADEFRGNANSAGQYDSDEEAAATDNIVFREEGDLKRRIDQAETVNAVTDLMLTAETQQALATLPAPNRDDVREHAKARLRALGWPSRPNRRASA